MEHLGIRETAYVHVVDQTHPRQQWHALLRVEKRVGDWTQQDIDAGRAPAPREIVDAENNLLTTAGATALWNGFVGSPSFLPFNVFNAQLAVGDGVIAPTVDDLDLGAVPGTPIAITGVSNTIPIVLTAANTFLQGQTVVVTDVGGTTSANNTWEVQDATSTTVTLKGAVPNAAYTAGGTVAPINVYRQQASAGSSTTVTGAQVQFAATVGTFNANFTWSEWALTLGGGLFNAQARPPPTLFNHAVPLVNMGTKPNTETWSFTVTFAVG